MAKATTKTDRKRRSPEGWRRKLEWGRRYYKKHPEKRREHKRKYRETNLAKIMAYEEGTMRNAA